MSGKQSQTDSGEQREVATLGGGCFWCIEAFFSELKGVEKVESGYSGGTVANPTYEEVCTGRTGHAEVVQITFNPSIISFREILQILFAMHDPTTLNRQGNDVGTQYRSVIFYHDERQKMISEEVIREVSNSEIWENPIVTQVEPFKEFYRAENYHQEYFKRNPGQSCCRVVITPKLAKLRAHYREMLKRP